MSEPFRPKAMTVTAGMDAERVTRDARKVLDRYLQRSRARSSTNVSSPPAPPLSRQPVFINAGSRTAVVEGVVATSSQSFSSSQESTSPTISQLPPILDSPVQMRKGARQSRPPPMLLERDGPEEEEDGAVNWREPAEDQDDSSCSPRSSTSSSLGRSHTNWRVVQLPYKNLDSVGSDTAEVISSNPFADFGVVGSRDTTYSQMSLPPTGGNIRKARKKSLYRRARERLGEGLRRQSSTESVSNKRVYSRQTSTSDPAIASLVQAAAAQHLRQRNERQDAWTSTALARAGTPGSPSGSSPEGSRYSTIAQQPVRKRKRKKRPHSTRSGLKNSSSDSNLSILERLFFSLRKRSTPTFVNPASSTLTPVSSSASPRAALGSESDASTNTPPMPPPPAKTAKVSTITQVFKQVLDKHAEKKTRVQPPQTLTVSGAPLARFETDVNGHMKGIDIEACSPLSRPDSPEIPECVVNGEVDPIEYMASMLLTISEEIEGEGATDPLYQFSLIPKPKPAPMSAQTATPVSSGEGFQLEEALRASGRRHKLRRQQHRHQHGPVTTDMLPQLSQDYETFSVVIEKLLLEEEDTPSQPGWHSISQLFVLTRQACRLAFASVSSTTAECIKEYSMQFFADRYAQWVVEQGGWRAVVEETEDSDLD